MGKKYNFKVNDAKSIDELAALRHSINVNDLHDEQLSFGDRIADGMASIAGPTIPSGA